MLADHKPGETVKLQIYRGTDSYARRVRRSSSAADSIRAQSSALGPQEACFGRGSARPSLSQLGASRRRR